VHGAPGRPAAEPDLAEGRRPGVPWSGRGRRHAVQRVLDHTDHEQRVPIRHGRLYVRRRQPGAQRHLHGTPERQRYPLKPNPPKKKKLDQKKNIYTTRGNRGGGPGYGRARGSGPEMRDFRRIVYFFYTVLY